MDKLNMQYFFKMSFLRKRVISYISILLSIISFISTIKINHDIAIRYSALDGKTQLLLGLTQFVGFYFKYYIVIIISFIAVGLSIIAFKKEESRNANVIACLLAIISLIVVSLNIWRFM